MFHPYRSFLAPFPQDNSYGSYLGIADVSGLLMHFIQDHESGAEKAADKLAHSQSFWDRLLITVTTDDVSMLHKGETSSSAQVRYWVLRMCCGQLGCLDCCLAQRRDLQLGTGGAGFCLVVSEGGVGDCVVYLLFELLFADPQALWVIASVWLVVSKVCSGGSGCWCGRRSV